MVELHIESLIDRIVIINVDPKSTEVEIQKIVDNALSKLKDSLSEIQESSSNKS